jgi:hypothetical protein
MAQNLTGVDSPTGFDQSLRAESPLTENETRFQKLERIRLLRVENLMLPNAHHRKPNNNGRYNLIHLNRLKTIEAQVPKDSPCGQ